MFWYDTTNNLWLKNASGDIADCPCPPCDRASCYRIASYTDGDLAACAACEDQAADIAALFNEASDEYLSTSDHADLSIGSGDWTISCFAYFTSSSGRRIATKWASDKPDREFTLNFVSGAIDFTVREDTGGGGGNEFTAISASTGQWYHIIAWHEDGNEIGLRLNDSTESTTAVTSGVHDGGAPFWVGANYRNPGDFPLHGRVCKMGVWKRLLTSAEKTALYNSGCGLSYADLTAGLKTTLSAWWNMDETSGDRTDSHGSHDLADNNTVGSADGPCGPLAWDGSFDRAINPADEDDVCALAADDTFIAIDGKTLDPDNTRIYYDHDEDRWELSIYCATDLGAATKIWHGYKAGCSPLGAYTRDSGCDATSSLTIEACP